ncbi:MarR family winged helix-turn-helix transcriptional regulator [Companilactobacillus furfuricola]|uniref:MarR family winged helix-turn-helix transcriptional regulator n=1 Tax=Companilactobacillus furfuricola TaxID=1462575 RepID=UPI000F78C6C8|nr:MarR family transcriptional regulator [Companilactobacillus furfuricola]
MEIEQLINLLYRLKMADLNMTEIFKGQTNINLTRYVLLLFLHRHGKMTQTDIQRELQINGSAISRHLKGLENKGYVTRIRNPENNREVVVELTQMAKETVGNCGREPGNKVLVDKFNDSFSPEEIKQLSELLSKLTKLEL